MLRNRALNCCFIADVNGLLNIMDSSKLLDGTHCLTIGRSSLQQMSKQKLVGFASRSQAIDLQLLDQALHSAVSLRVASCIIVLGQHRRGFVDSPAVCGNVSWKSLSCAKSDDRTSAGTQR